MVSNKQTAVLPVSCPFSGKEGSRWRSSSITGPGQSRFTGSRLDERIEGRPTREGVQVPASASDVTHMEL